MSDDEYLRDLDEADGQRARKARVFDLDEDRERSKEEHDLILETLAGAMAAGSRRALECLGSRSDGSLCRECHQHMGRLKLVTERYLIESGVARRPFWTYERAVVAACFVAGPFMNLFGLAGWPFFLAAIPVAFAISQVAWRLGLPNGTGLLQLGPPSRLVARKGAER